MDVQGNQFIYYDSLISKYNSDSTSIPIIFNDTRSAPLIKDTTGYCMSIVRFTLDTQTLPIFIPTMKDVSSDTTVYSITLSYQGVSVQTYMQFIPQNTARVSEYYYVYTYSYVCELINNTFQQCLTALINACTFAGKTIDPTIVAPSITYDPTTQLFAIEISDTVYGTSSDAINIYFNNALQNLFGFNSYFKTINSSNGMNYMLINNGTSIIAQEISSIGNLSPILSIVFTSTQLPIIQNVTSNPNVYVNGVISNQNSSNSAYPIITDMVPNGFVFTSNIIYVPSGTYRYISLIPNNRIQNVDFQVYWLNKLGDLIPIYLNTGSCCTMKVLFQKNYK